MSELVIDFFDKNLNFLGVIDNAEDVTFTRSWYEIGDFTIKYNINANPDYAGLLAVGNIIMINKNVYKTGKIKSVSNEIGERGRGDQYRIAKGFELKTIFQQRIISQTNYVDTENGKYWYMSAPAETCIKSLITDQCGTGSINTKRKFSTLQVATDSARGSNYVIAERGSSLYNVIFNCASAALIGWYCYLDPTNKKIIFDCSLGKDRTSSQSTNSWAIFSADRDTLKEAKITQDVDKDYANDIMLAGSSSWYESYSGTEPSDMDRYERWMDQTSIKATDTQTESAQLAEIGSANLAKYSQTYILDGSPLAFSQLVYMTNYDIGDTVEVNDGTNTYSVQILSAQEEWQNNNYNLTLTWGKPQPSVTRQLFESINRAKGTAITASSAEIVATTAQATATTAKMRQFATVALVNAATGQYDGEIVYCLANCHFYKWILSTTSWSDTSATLPNDPAAYWSADETPDIPDYAAGITYLSNFASGTDGWSGNNVTPTVSNSVLHAGANGIFGHGNIGATGIVIYRLRSVNGAPQTAYIWDGCGGGVDVIVGTDYANYQVVIPSASNTYFGFSGNYGTIDVKAIYIGTGQYSTPLLDNSGNDLHGTIYGATPVAGVSGRGLAFDGVNDYVDFDITKDNWTGAFTRSFWVSGAARTTQQYLYSRDTSAAGGRGIRLFLSASNLPSITISQDGTAVVSLAAAAGNECTSDCMITFEFVPSTGMYIYKNGKLIASLATGVPSLAFWSASQNSRIGSLASTTYYSGWLDEMPYFKRALSASEVLGLYLAKSLEKRYVLADWQLDQGASDGVISNSIDKPRYREDWYKIWAADQRTIALPTTFASITTAGEYKELATDANTMSIWTPTTGGTAAKTYYDAVESLRFAYFNNGTVASDGSGFLLSSSTGDVTISSMSPTLNARLNTYRASADALSAAITTAKQNAAVSTAGSNVATLAPSYIGIGILAGASTAAFTGATVDSAGVITVGGSVTPKTGDWMVNYASTYVAIGIYYWNGSTWTASTAIKYIDSCSTDLLNLSTGGISINGVATILIALVKNLFAQYIKVLTGGSIRGGDRYDETGAVVDGTKPGFFIGASGACKVAGITFEGSQGGGVQWGSPIKQGTSLTITGAGVPALCYMGNNNIAFIDDINESLRTYHWNSESWSLVGSGLSIPTISLPAITRLTNTDIAYIDGGVGQLKTYRWNGSAWSMVGSALSITISGNPTITALTATTIALLDSSGTNALRTYSWDGSNWSLVAPGLTTNAIPSIVAINSTDIAYANSNNGYLRTYRWDGGTWTPLSTGSNIGISGHPAITTLNGTDVVIMNPTTDELAMYRWDGSLWNIVGSSAKTSILSAGYPSIAAMNGCDIVYFDNTNKKLDVYRFGFALSVPYQP